MADHRPARPKRKHPVHGIRYVEGQPTIIFDTLCLRDRRPILARDEFHSAFREVAEKATAWIMGRYVIMPDHIHFFAGDVGGEIPYENWVKYPKSQLTKRVGRARLPPSRDVRAKRPARQEPRPPGGGDLVELRWLPDHWDCRMRNRDAYEQKWQYVRYNAVRAGLVASPDDWPYQGEFFELRWH